MSETSRGTKGGAVAVCLLSAVSLFWTYWGFLEMFHEGWFGTFWERARYLIPPGTCLLLTAITLRAPRFGGTLLIVLGVAFGSWWTSLQLARGADLVNVLIVAPLGFGLAVIGFLFLHEGWKERGRRGRRPRWRSWLGLGAPLLLGLGISAVRLPQVLSRVDDGRRDERSIEGNGVTLIWAPAGPGWGLGLGTASGHPSWNRIAWYGKLRTLSEE